MAQSISDSIAILYHFLTQAQAAADASKPSRSLRDALVRASEALKPWVGVTDEATALAYFVDTGADSLRISADGFDRDAGEAACRRVEGILMADLVEDPFNVDQVRQLVTEWKTATRQPGTRSSGTSAVPDLGFTVKVKHEATGEIVGSTTKDNLNSLRDQVRKFHAAKVTPGRKPSKGEPVWQGVTDALEAVMHKGTQAAQGGGYIVDKAA